MRVAGVAGVAGVVVTVGHARMLGAVRAVTQSLPVILQAP
jgi:hypothetical protein